MFLAEQYKASHFQGNALQSLNCISYTGYTEDARSEYKSVLRLNLYTSLTNLLCSALSGLLPNTSPLAIVSHTQSFPTFLLCAEVVSTLAAILTDLCSCWYHFCSHRFISRPRKTPWSTSSAGRDSTMAVSLANNQGIGWVQEFCIGHNLQEKKVVVVMGEKKTILKAYFQIYRILQLGDPQWEWGPWNWGMGGKACMQEYFAFVVFSMKEFLRM